MEDIKKEEIPASVMDFVEAFAAKPEKLSYDIHNNEPLVVRIRTVLPFTARGEMVRTIVNMVFLNKGLSFDDYIPENFEFAKRYVAVAYFTDFKLPKDINDAWLVLYNTPLYEDVMKIVQKSAQDIFDVAENLIQARLYNIAQRSKMDDLIETINAKLSTMNFDITSDQIKSVVESMQSIKDIKPENLVGAIVKAQEEKEDKK